MEAKFQFHYGSVKRAFVFKQGGYSLKFQFHYGSVKSNTDGLEKLRIDLFQFHYGSVKSLLLSIILLILFYFNSTMVRLKVVC